MSKTEIFIEKARKIHGDKYDYSLVDYKTNKTNIIIICPIHGQSLQTPSNHLRYNGCRQCSFVKRTKSTEQFIIESNIIHNNKYDYSLVKYDGNKKLVEIICPIHKKSFFQTPNHHLRLQGCPYCDNKLCDTETFIEKARKIHGDKYDYSLVDYKAAKTKIIIICNIHNKSFLQTPDDHLAGKGCKLCKQSRGEITVAKILTELNIKYEQEYNIKVQDDGIIKILRADFYLSEYNLIIEYNGKQHYQIVDLFGGLAGYNKTLYRDNLKRKYCKECGIKMLHIPYIRRTITDIKSDINEFLSDNDIILY